MSLSKEIAHDLRAVTTQPSEIAVLPQWAKVIPITFFLGFTVLLLWLAWNNFNANIFIAKQNALNDVVRQYQELMAIDKQTTSKLITQRNAAISIARWVDYTPMIQPMLVSIFAALDEKVQINSMALERVERKDGVLPEYTLNFAFSTAQNNVNAIIENIRAALLERNWRLTTVSQVFQEGVTNFQGYLQPTGPGAVFESQYLSIIQDPSATVIKPTGAAQ